MNSISVRYCVPIATEPTTLEPGLHSGSKEKASAGHWRNHESHLRASALRRRLALLAHYIDEPEALDLALEMRQIADELRDETIPWYRRRKQWTAPEEE